MTKNKTTVVIAHRLSTILNANNKFALSASLPIILNLFMIFGILYAYVSSNNFLLFLSWSVIIGGIVQIICLIASLKNNKISIFKKYEFVLFSR